MYDEAIARLFAHIEKLDQDIAFLQQERIAAREAIIRLGGNPDGNSLLAEIDALKSEIELLRVELGNRPSPGQKPVDVWPDRW